MPACLSKMFLVLLRSLASALLLARSKAVMEALGWLRNNEAYKDDELIIPVIVIVTSCSRWDIGLSIP